MVKKGIEVMRKKSVLSIFPEREKPRIAIIIEARMTSSRLPGKVMLPVSGKPLLSYLIERVRRSKYMDEVVVATTVNSQDEPIVRLVKDMGVKAYRGSETDVLKRVLDAARSVDADIIAEITGDCPLNDPLLIDRTIYKYLKSFPDYHYVQIGGFWGKDRTLPDGFGASVFSAKDLEFVERIAHDPADREHVSLSFYSGKYPFRIFSIKVNGVLRWPELALTLDTIEDFRVIKYIIEHLYAFNPRFTCRDVINFVKKNPGLRDINRHITRKYVTL